MSTRPMFLRGFSGPTVLDRPQHTVPMTYRDDPKGCSTCRDSELHCTTPDSCLLPTAEQIEEAKAVSSLHRLSWPLCMLVIALAAIASKFWPWGFAG